jgi:hypothetical protein
VSAGSNFLRRAVCLLAAAGLVSCAANGVCGTDCMRILFIGNSYTYENDLPCRLAELASAGGHPVETAMEATGGWTLAQHDASPDTLSRLNGDHWDYVILQEQSEIPALWESRETGMYTAVRDLAGRVRAAGARPVLFLTWAHRDGLAEYGAAMDFDTMQDALTEGYRRIAHELDLPIAPAGEAWRLARQRDATLGLWQEDGSHPDPNGTYLAACVFYAALFGQSPEGLAYTGGLAPDTARFLQRAAADTVLSDPAAWNLD